MEKTFYELTKTYEEFSASDKGNKGKIVQGCSLWCENPEVIKKFESKEEALKELENYRTDLCYFHSSGIYFCGVTEYSVIEMTYDEDDEFVSGGDAWEITKMPERKDED